MILFFSYVITMQRLHQIVIAACFYAFMCFSHPIYNEFDDTAKYMMRVNDPIISDENEPQPLNLDFVIMPDNEALNYEEFKNFGKNDFNKRGKKLNVSHLSFAEPLRILKEKADKDRARWLVYKNKQTMYDKGKRLSAGDLDTRQDDYREDEDLDVIQGNEKSCRRWLRFLQEQSSQNNLDSS